MIRFVRSLLLAVGLLLALAAHSQEAPRISNVFTDADVQSVLTEVATAASATILADTSVKGMTITLELKEDTVESALEKVCLLAGLSWKKKESSYLVSTAAPDAPLYSEFAVTRLYRPRTQPAESLYGLLAKSFQAYAAMDREANLLTITAPEKLMKLIWAALQEADRPGRQFVLEALITEMSSEVVRESGFSWSWRYFAQGAGLGIVAAATQMEDVLKVKQLLTEKKASLRANPRVLATEGREAMLTVGTETYVKLATDELPGIRGTQYQKINTGISLKFIGFLEEDGTLNLHLQPEVSDAITTNDGNPSTTVRRMSTHLRVRPGETVAIGGLIQSSEVRRDSKTPVLGDLPLVGALFRGSKRERSETEVVMLITPKLTG